MRHVIIPDEYKSIGTQWVVIYFKNDAAYFLKQIFIDDSHKIQ